MSQTIAVTELPFPLVRRGKVRDVYDVGDDRLLIVATDRISAFDVVMPQPIPDKGAVLTQITAWWLAQGGPFWPNHLISADAAEITKALPQIADLRSVWPRGSRCRPVSWKARSCRWRSSHRPRKPKQATTRM